MAKQSTNKLPLLRRDQDVQRGLKQTKSMSLSNPLEPRGRARRRL
jgi:hypothetical protein